MNAQTLMNCLLVVLVLQLSFVVLSLESRATVTSSDPLGLYWLIAAFGPLIVVPLLLAWHFAHPRKTRLSTYVNR